MAWQLLAAAIPTVAKIATTAINKPKQSDYKPQTKYMEKYLANLRGQQSSNAVFEQAMRPALRTIGAQSRQQQQQIGYNVQRSGLAGSGIEAQQRLTASQGTQEALAGATERAASAQSVANQQLGREAMKVSSQIEMERERSAQAYNQAMRQYDANLKGAFIEGVANVATAGAGMAMTNAANERKLEAARSVLGGQADTYLEAGFEIEDIYNASVKTMKENEIMFGDNDNQSILEEKINEEGGFAEIAYNNTENIPDVDPILDITNQPTSTSSEIAQGNEAVSPTASDAYRYDPETGRKVTKEYYESVIMGQDRPDPFVKYGVRPDRPGIEFAEDDTPPNAMDNPLYVEDLEMPKAIPEFDNTGPELPPTAEERASEAQLIQRDAGLGDTEVIKNTAPKRPKAELASDDEFEDKKITVTDTGFISAPSDAEFIVSGMSFPKSLYGDVFKNIPKRDALTGKSMEGTKPDPQNIVTNQKPPVKGTAGTGTSLDNRKPMETVEQFIKRHKKQELQVLAKTLKSKSAAAKALNNANKKSKTLFESEVSSALKQKAMDQIEMTDANVRAFFRGTPKQIADRMKRSDMFRKGVERLYGISIDPNTGKLIELDKLESRKGKPGFLDTVTEGMGEY